MKSLLRFLGYTCGEIGHHFFPRYSEEPSGIFIEEAEGISAKDLRCILMRKVYIFDICKYCGKIVEKGK